MIEKTVKRTIWVVTCPCGSRKEWTENPPREIQCKCKNWVKPIEVSWIGPEIKESK